MRRKCISISNMMPLPVVQIRMAIGYFLILVLPANFGSDKEQNSCCLCVTTTGTKVLPICSSVEERPSVIRYEPIQGSTDESSCLPCRHVQTIALVIVVVVV